MKNKVYGFCIMGLFFAFGACDPADDAVSLSPEELGSSQTRVEEAQGDDPEQDSEEIESSEETSWQEDVSYPFPSEEMMAIWTSPYTYPYQECFAVEEDSAFPAEAVTVNEEGESEVCIWQNAQGCVPEGMNFNEVASCDVAMTTSARFFKFPGYKYESDITLMDQPEYETEADWARDQVRACGCLCCHDSKEGAEEGFATAFDIGAEGIWTDTMTDFGLLTAAGIVDTELLGGTFDPETNHGFNRVKSIFPSSDEERMVAFFLGELDRRGLSQEEIQELVDSVPLRFAGLYTNYTGPTEVCEPGFGVDVDGTVHWGGVQDARYVYVLEEGSANVADPPGLDTPEGILWRMDVEQGGTPYVSGSVTYGVAPEGGFTRIPAEGDAPALVEGTTYKLFVLRDFGPLRIANCTFVYGETVEPVTP